MHRAFIATPKAVSYFISQLKLQKPDTWEPVYLDPSTGAEWIGYRLDDNPGDLPPTMLRKKRLSLQEACVRAATTDFDDEAAAAGHYIRWMIPSDAAFMGLLSALETAVVSEHSERRYRNAVIALAWSDLGKPFNFRPVVGKSAATVDKDYIFYESIFARADVLISKANALFGITATKDSNAFRDC